MIDTTPVAAGDPIALRHGDWNGVRVAAAKVEAAAGDAGVAIGRGGRHGLRVRNNSGVALPAFTPIAITGPTVTPSVDPPSGPDFIMAGIALRVGTPWGVTQEAIGPGLVGRAAISGATWCRLPAGPQLGAGVYVGPRLVGGVVSIAFAGMGGTVLWSGSAAAGAEVWAIVVLEQSMPRPVFARLDQKVSGSSLGSNWSAVEVGGVNGGGPPNPFTWGTDPDDTYAPLVEWNEGLAAPGDTVYALPSVGGLATSWGFYTQLPRAIGEKPGTPLVIGGQNDPLDWDLLRSILANT